MCLAKLLLVAVVAHLKADHFVVQDPPGLDVRVGLGRCPALAVSALKDLGLNEYPVARELAPTVTSRELSRNGLPVRAMDEMAPNDRRILAIDARTSSISSMVSAFPFGFENRSTGTAEDMLAPI